MATHSSILAWRIPWTEEPGATAHGTAKSQTRLSHKHFAFPAAKWGSLIRRASIIWKSLMGCGRPNNGPLRTSTF